MCHETDSKKKINKLNIVLWSCCSTGSLCVFTASLLPYVFICFHTNFITMQTNKEKEPHTYKELTR